MSHVLRHISASGDALKNFWDWDPIRQRLIATIQTGSSPPADVEIGVCSRENPRPGSFLLRRLSEERWSILPVWMLLLHTHRGGIWVERKAMILESIGFQSLDLIQAPPAICRELEQV